jgi:hypothetical protein
MITITRPAASVKPIRWSPEPYRLAELVSQGQACWINAGPNGGPTPPCWADSNPARDIVSDDAARAAYDDAREAEAGPCCPDDEPMPCTACLDADAWDDDDVVALGPDDEPATMDLAELCLHEAAIFRSWNTDAGDLFAERFEHLAARIRFLGATTVGQYRDRLEAMLDAVRDAAEARMASRCC